LIRRHFDPDIRDRNSSNNNTSTTNNKASNNDNDNDKDNDNNNSSSSVNKGTTTTPVASDSLSSMLLFFQGRGSRIFEAGDLSFMDIGWAVNRASRGSLKSTFTHWGTCIGVMECANKCGFTGRPYTYTPDSETTYKSRQFCRGACYERGVAQDERRLVLRGCGVKMRWLCNGAGEQVTFEQFGSHDHVRPPLLKMTAVEKSDLQKSVALGTPAKKNFCSPTSRAALRISMFGV